jgi:ribosomal protein S18 acetylase RimI-like enzyme
MTKSDLHDVVKLHQQAFQGFFLEQMGPSFIKAYYKIVLAYEGSITYVYQERGSFVEGFVVGFIDPAAFYKKFIRSGLQLVHPILSGVVRNPKLLLKMVENIRRVLGVKSQSSKFFVDKETAELSSIAVGNSAKGSGSMLIQAFVKEAWLRGLINITLTTDYEDNELVNNFYIKHNFTRNGIEIRNGRKLCRYILTKN